MQFVGLPPHEGKCLHKTKQDDKARSNTWHSTYLKLNAQ